MTARYITPLSAVASPVWVPLRDGRLITTEPLRSGDGVATYARLPYRDALAIAAEFGAELPTREDVVELHEIARGLGTELRPVTLPTPAICAQHLVSWRDEAGKQRLREQLMMTAEWAEVHDQEVAIQRDAAWALLLARRQDVLLLGPRGVPWGNIGKPWIAGASPGRARLMGWHVEGDLARDYGLPASGGWIQDGVYPPGSTHEQHEAGYADYSSTVVLVRAA